MRNRAHEWFAARASQGTAGWRGTDALARGVVCGVGLVAAGLLLHQLELVFIGAPLLFATVLAAPVSGEPVIRVRPRPRTTEEGSSERLAVTVDPGPRTELLAIRLPRPDDNHVGPVHLLPASVTTIRTRVRWSSWGEGVELRPDYLLAGGDALCVFGPVVGRELRRVVLPPVHPLPAGPLPPRTAGLVGAHRSPRSGDGTELRDIRPFQPGDRLRKVDWRVSLRAAASAGGLLAPGTLHVRERHAEADADLVLALDTRVDVGADVGAWADPQPGAGMHPGGSLDTGVRLTVALAASYLRQGDRVGLVDLGWPRLGLPPGGGRRQLDRIRHRLVSTGRLAGAQVVPVLRAGQVPPGALVIVLSPFLDDEVVDAAAHAVRRGHLVLAVDLLPTGLTPARDSPWGDAALRILRAEHRIRLDVLREHGVPSVHADDAAALAEVLRRARRRRRVAVR